MLAQHVGDSVSNVQGGIEYVYEVFVQLAGTTCFDLLFCCGCCAVFFFFRLNTSGWRTEVEYRKARRERVLPPHEPLFRGRLEAFCTQQRLLLRVRRTITPALL